MKMPLYVFVGFVAFVWPVIHVFLVTNTGISPWRLGGWGMYSAPIPDKYRSVFIREKHLSGSISTKCVFDKIPNVVFVLSHEKAQELKGILSQPSKRQEIYIKGVSREVTNYLAFPIKLYEKHIISLCKNLIQAGDLECFIVERRYNLFGKGFVDNELSPRWQCKDSIFPLDRIQFK